jgi:hypothetical protein
MACRSTNIPYVYVSGITIGYSIS